MLDRDGTFALSHPARNVPAGRLEPEMAKRVRKTYKQRQRELDTPEVVEETLWSLSDWMEANWKPIVMGLGALTVVWGGIGVVQMISASSERSAAESSANVFSALNKPVYEKPADLEGEDPNKPLGETFGSEKHARTLFSRRLVRLNRTRRRR